MHSDFLQLKVLLSEPAATFLIGIVFTILYVIVQDKNPGYRFYCRNWHLNYNMETKELFSMNSPSPQYMLGHFCKLYTRPRKPYTTMTCYNGEVGVEL